MPQNVYTRRGLGSCPTNIWNAERSQLGRLLVRICDRMVDLLGKRTKSMEKQCVLATDVDHAVEGDVSPERCDSRCSHEHEPVGDQSHSAHTGLGEQDVSECTAPNEKPSSGDGRLPPVFQRPRPFIGRVDRVLHVLRICGCV